MGGGFPIDLVLFGLVAAFLVLRLVSILGKRTGFEQPAEPAMPDGGVNRAALRPQPGVIDAVAEPPPVASRALPDPQSPLGQTLQLMTSIDRNFTPQRFLEGAEAAFRIIVLGFAAGERTKLHPLLTSDTYAAFEGAIAAREAEGHTQITEIRSIESAAIDHAELAGTVASITVRFVSDQVNVTNGANGLPVFGADAVTEITDIWSFERDLAQSDPAWRLAAARSA
jgi:predicted lipid-binding transport protein (Tim44 family)